MNDTEIKQRIIQNRFASNNGIILRTVNMLGKKYTDLDDLRYGLEPSMSENDLTDCIDYLSRSGYVELRDIRTHAVEQFLISLVRSVIHIGKNIMGADVADNAEIEIDFDRSVIIDDTAERLQDLQEVRDGVQAPWEFRVKYYGATEEDAKKILEEINGVKNVDLGFGDEA